MIDIELIIKKYSLMSNDKLIKFAKKEQYNLTDSAVGVLLIEIQKGA